MTASTGRWSRWVAKRLNVALRTPATFGSRATEFGISASHQLPTFATGKAVIETGRTAVDPIAGVAALPNSSRQRTLIWRRECVRSGSASFSQNQKAPTNYEDRDRAGRDGICRCNLDGPGRSQFLLGNGGIQCARASGRCCDIHGKGRQRKAHDRQLTLWSQILFMAAITIPLAASNGL